MDPNVHISHLYGFLILHTLQLIYGYEDLYSQELVHFQDLINDGSILEKLELHSKVHCLLACLKNRACMSLFYNSNSSVCSLQAIVYLDPSQATVEVGSRYYIAFDPDKCPLDNGYMHNRELNICYCFKAAQAFNIHLLKAMCANYSGELMKIDSQEKQDHLAMFLDQEATTYTLIQGSDEDVTGQWKYDDGTDMEYINWHVAGGQPNRLSEHYITLTKTSNFLWHDAFASYSSLKSNMLCQKQLN